MITVQPVENIEEIDVPSVTDVLLELVSKNTEISDIHIEQDRKLALTLPTGWTIAEDINPISQHQIVEFLDTVKPDWQIEITNRAVSEAIDLCSCRLRINAFLTKAGGSISVSIRRQPLHPRPLEDTGLPKYIRTLINKPSGLILVTGQTGAGKTTTLASILDSINRTRNGHIITIEDPIEFVHERNKCIFSMKEVGRDTPSYAQGLHDALRQKPDVIMVGEIRDRETAETVLEAADSGHLVLATLHTNSSTGAINRLLGWFPDEINHRSKMLADSLIAIISQTLVTSTDGMKKVLASEVLVNANREMSEAIASPASHAKVRDLINRSSDQMSQSLNRDLCRLVHERKITIREAIRHSNDRLEIDTMLSSRPSA